MTILIAVWLCLSGPIASLANTQKISAADWATVPQWSPDGRLYVVQLFDPEQKKPMRQYAGGKPDVVMWPKHTAMVESDSGRIVWTAPTENFSGAWSPDGTKWAGQATKMNSSSVSMDTEVTVYDAGTGKVLLQKRNLPPLGVRWAPDSGTLAVTGFKYAELWQVAKHDRKKLQVTAPEFIRYPEWSVDGRDLSVLCSTGVHGSEPDDVLVVLDVETGKEVWRRGGGSMPGPLRWNKRGNLAGYTDRSGVHVVDGRTFAAVRAIPMDCSGGMPRSIEWLPDDALLYEDSDKVLHVVAPDGNERARVQLAKSGYSKTDMSPNSSRLVCTESNNEVAVFDLGSGQCLGHEHIELVQDAQWNFDGTALVVDVWNERPRLVQLNKGAGAPMIGASVDNPWTRVAVVATVEDCLEQFRKDLSAAQLQKFSSCAEQRVGEFGGGSFLFNPMMSNVYDRWGKDKLFEYFKTQGITDERDVFGIVLHSFWRKLNNKPLALQEQIADHKQWWDHFQPIIEEKRPLSQALLDASLRDDERVSHSMRVLPGTLKVVAFIDLNCEPSNVTLQCLKDLRQRYDASELGIMVVKFSNELMGYSDKQYAGVHDSGADMAKLLSGHRLGFPVVNGSQQTLDDLEAFARPIYRGMPQVLLMRANNEVICRLNVPGFDSKKESLDKILRERIDGALKLIRITKDR